MEVLGQLVNKKNQSNDPIVKAIMDAIDGLNEVWQTVKTSLKFLELKKRSSCYGDWIEYNFVLDCNLTSDTPTCLLNRFLEISEFLKRLTELKLGANLNLSSMGIQEVKCDESGHLYFGMYIIKDVGCLRNIPEYDMTKDIINLIENDEL